MALRAVKIDYEWKMWKDQYGDWHYFPLPPGTKAGATFPGTDQEGKKPRFGLINRPSKMETSGKEGEGKEGEGEEETFLSKLNTPVFKIIAAAVALLVLYKYRKKIFAK